MPPYYTWRRLLKIIGYLYIYISSKWAQSLFFQNEHISDQTQANVVCRFSTTVALIAIYLGILNGFLFCLLVTFIFDYMCILIIKQNKNPLSIHRCITISAIVVKQRQTTFACVGSLICSFWKKKRLFSLRKRRKLCPIIFRANSWWILD